eukprot:12931282-Prorocentrum_lima.AAC.1
MRGHLSPCDGWIVSPPCGEVNALARRLSESDRYSTGTAIEIPPALRDEFRRTVENNWLRVEAPLDFV